MPLWINAESKESKYYYDNLSRLRGVDGPDGSSNWYYNGNPVDVLYEYDDVGDLTTKKDANGTFTYNYDDIYRLKEIWRYDGQQSTLLVDFIYDKAFFSYSPASEYINPKGRLGKMRTYGVDSIMYYYNDRGDMSRKVIGINGLSSLRLSTYKYNIASACTLLSTSGHSVKYHYDCLGRLKDIPNLINNLTYNPAGQITKIQRPNGVIDTFTYDNRLRPTLIRAYKTSDILKLGYWYEPNSNVDSIADYLNSQYSQGFAYEALNRLTNVYSTGGIQSFTYDAVGNRLSKTGASYTYYTGTNRLKTDHRGWTYYYDNNGNITSRSDGANFTYDWNNRLIQYTKGIKSLDFAYNASGLRVKKHYSESMPPEAQGELGSLFTDGINDLGIKSKGSDSLYNKGRDIDKVWAKGSGSYYEFAIVYRHLFSETGKMKLFITLDLDTIPNSGRITLPEDTMTRVSKKAAWEYCIYVGDNEYGLYQYLTNFHLTNYQSMPYGMSVVKTPGPAGIVKIKILKSLLSDAPMLRFTVSSFAPDQLLNPNPDTLHQGGSRASDVYPGSPEVFGGEIPGYVQVSSGGVAPTGAVVEYTVYYIYDGINPILELAPNNSILTRYVYAGGLHIAKISGADTLWYHCDALGSPRKMTNESGAVVWTGAYQPFGEMLSGSGNVHGFTGKELDFESGLNYFCQRYYDSQIGRFMTLDPVDDKSGISPYAYCSNNPLRFTDPTGEKFSDLEMEEKFWFMKDYGIWKAGQPDLWSTFASWPGSMASYMKAHHEFYAQVYLNEYISQMMHYYAKHDYFKQTYQYGTTTVEIYEYFNPIVMAVMIGLNRYENPELVAGSGAGMGSTYTPEVELSLMISAYYKFIDGNYPIHGSTLVPAYAVRYLIGDRNIWTCADWSYELNSVFESMNLKYWQTKVVNIWKVHSLVSANYNERTRYFDPYFMAPFLYGFQVFPPLPYR